MHGVGGRGRAVDHQRRRAALGAARWCRRSRAQAGRRAEFHADQRKPEALAFDDAETTGAQLPDPALDPEAAFGRREGLMQLDRALAALPVALRECLVLHELEELSYKDVARITGLPMGTVMSRLWRARRLLLRACAGAGRR